MFPCLSAADPWKMLDQKAKRMAIGTLRYILFCASLWEGQYRWNICDCLFNKLMWSSVDQPAGWASLGCAEHSPCPQRWMLGWGSWQPARVSVKEAVQAAASSSSPAYSFYPQRPGFQLQLWVCWHHLPNSPWLCTWFCWVIFIHLKSLEDREVKIKTDW